VLSRPAASWLAVRIAAGATDQKSHLTVILCAIEPGAPVADTLESVTEPEGDASVSGPEELTQPFELGFTYTRSTGPVIGRFLGELKRKRIVGNRSSDGRVIVPPMEFDPVTAEALDEFVEVGAEGEIVTWAWVREPRGAHPLSQPFAWAMIRLDGADVPMIHCVAAEAEEQLATGARVRACWADEPRGFISDIRYFERIEA
jgi:uncharacterized OB-fold protein